jgi:FkbM family methyltransferase
LPQVKTNNCALLDKSATITFTDYGPKYSAFNTFEKRNDSGLSFLKKEEAEITVQAITLDSYTAEHSVSPTFIKIDAEGTDYLVLKGMKETLQKSRPFISLEVAGGEEWETNHNESMAFLDSMSYGAFEVSDDGYLSKHERKATYAYDNLIFVPSEKINSIQDLIQ